MIAFQIYVIGVFKHDSKSTHHNVNLRIVRGEGQPSSEFTVTVPDSEVDEYKKLTGKHSKPVTLQF